MVRHGPGRQLHPAFQTWDAPPKTLLVSGPLSFTPTTERLLWYLCVNHLRLAGHDLGFFYISHQANSSEESNKRIDGPLEPTCIL